MHKNRIKNRFALLAQTGKKALITFITAGDHGLEATKRMVLEMEKQGADIIELGIPYSDPIAEGPVIQAANERALSEGVKITHIMDMVAELRKETEIPILFLLYFNCLYRPGVENFIRRCAQSGVDGLIIPDLPIEERDGIDEIGQKYGVDLIYLVTPTSGDERIRTACNNATGFLYCVSSLGVTGMRSNFETDFDSFFGLIRKHCKIPTALGFGISTPEQAAALKKYSDGIIVGSAIVKRVGASATASEAVKNVGEFTAALCKALDG